jgi:hypothetical protein
MAQRGRPKKDQLSLTEKKAREQGVTYGEYIAEETKKTVVIEKKDDVERIKVSERMAKAMHIPDRAKKAIEEAAKQTEEDIENHKSCIKKIQQEIDQHIGCIRTHEQAIKELEEELKEEKDFIAQFS